MALAILFGALFTVAVSIAAGALLLGDDVRAVPLRFVVGSSLLSVLVFAICSIGLAYTSVFACTGAAILAVGFRSLRWPSLRLDPKKNALPRILMAAFALYFVLYFFNAMAPEISYDGTRYHLGLVGRYLREHGFHPITGSFYAWLSQGVEMLYLFAYAFGRHSAASLVHFFFLTALAWLVFDYGRRHSQPLAGCCAALLVFASPGVGVTAASAYNDVAVAAIAFALFYVLQLWSENDSPRLLIAAGLLAGFAFAAKYTAWAAIPYAIGFVAWRRRRVRDVAILGLCAATLALPWIARTWLWTGNPIAPFGNALFPNPYATVTFEREYRHHMAWYGLASRAEIPLSVTVRGSIDTLLGPVFLLAPLGLLALRRREGRELLLAALVFGINYFANIGARFLIPSLPFVTLALCLSLSRFPRLLLSVAVVHALISWPSVVRRYCAPEAWHLVKIPYREALRIKPEQGFLESNLPLYGVDVMLERFTPAGSTIFTSTPIPEAYTSRNILVTYQSATNVISRQVWFSGFVPEHMPTWRLHFVFPRQPLTAIRVTQTASGTDVWSIHELRVFSGAAELPGRPGWQWTAQPYPWAIENIRDDRAASFWTSGETLRPGEFVSVDWHSPAEADSVLIEAAPNQWGIRLTLEGRDPSGRWTFLSGAHQPDTVAPPPAMRRAAAAELKRRGIDYLLVFDNEFGAADLRDHTSEWGVEPVAEHRGARLYRLP